MFVIRAGLVLCCAVFVCGNASAGVVSQVTDLLLFERFCPDSDNEADCIAETNADASKRQGYLDSSADGAFVEVSNGEGSWGDMVLDPTQLNLPQSHMHIESNPNERRTIGALGVQEYLWQGVSDTLTFTSNFDFTMSLGDWNGTVDSYAYAEIGVYRDLNIEFDSSGHVIFPISDNPADLIAFASYESANDTSLLSNVLRQVVLSVSFEVNPGDTFYLEGYVQGLAMNGGMFDAANSFLTNLTAATTPAQNLSTALVPLTSVPLPSTLVLLGLGFVGLGLNRRKSAAHVQPH